MKGITFGDCDPSRICQVILARVIWNNDYIGSEIAEPLNIKHNPNHVFTLTHWTNSSWQKKKKKCRSWEGQNWEKTLKKNVFTETKLKSRNNREMQEKFSIIGHKHVISFLKVTCNKECHLLILKHISKSLCVIHLKGISEIPNYVLYWQIFLLN